MTDQKYTLSFTNRTGSYVLLGDTSDVIFVGSQAECQARYNNINIETSKWGDIQVVSPNETVTGDYLHSDFQMPKFSGDFAGLCESE